MGKCEVCGNEYEFAFQVTMPNGESHTFDSFECAIHKVAPICDHCGCHVIGHGVTAKSRIYCCATCAHSSGAHEIVDNASHVGQMAR